MTSALEHRARVQRPAHPGAVPRTPHSTSAMHRDARRRPRRGAARSRARATLAGTIASSSDDGLHGQDGAAQPLHERSPTVTRVRWTAYSGAARVGARADRARRGEQQLRVARRDHRAGDQDGAPSPGSPVAGQLRVASSASATAASMASSRRSCDVHPVLAEDVPGQLGQFVGGHRRAARSSWSPRSSTSTGSSSSSTPATSLSSATATTPMIRVEVERLGQRLHASPPCPPGCAPRPRSPSASAAGCRAARASSTLANPARTRSGSRPRSTGRGRG